MTYREWITGTIARFGAGAADAELILINQERLIPDQDATVDVTKAKTALCREFATVIPLANISEGGYSVSWNMQVVSLWYNQSCTELGITPVNRPRISNKSNVW
ncbi:MAG: hypothetical protein LBJ01_12075 [Tannerella sp.]|jgi:hypothetical protein|nr:hypothetical protein [Tannerella sp.]